MSNKLELHSMLSFNFILGAIPDVHPNTIQRPIDLQHTIRSDCNYWNTSACHQHAPVDIV